MTESYRGYCPIEDLEDVLITPQVMNPDRHICFSCGGDVNRPERTIPSSPVDAEYSGRDHTPPLEDMTYDQRQERDAPDVRRDVSDRQVVSKRTRRRQRQAALARAAAARRVVL